MIRNSHVMLKGRKSRILAELARSMRKVVSYFNHALKYRVANLLGYGETFDSTSPVSQAVLCDLIKPS
jgi:hypothetical protein